MAVSVQVLSTHGTQCKYIRQTYIICQMTNVDAMIGHVSVRLSMIRGFTQSCQVRFPDAVEFWTIEKKVHACVFV